MPARSGHCVLRPDLFVSQITQSWRGLSLVLPGVDPGHGLTVGVAGRCLSWVPHLAVTPLRFASPSPSSGWTEDFHLQAVVHTRHTKKEARQLAGVTRPVEIVVANESAP
jgi:hypothetical protein